MHTIHTCPSDAAATGSGEISEKIASIGKFSSFSIVSKATSEENGAILSCSKESSAKYEGGTKSWKEHVSRNHITFNKQTQRSNT